MKKPGIAEMLFVTILLLLPFLYAAYIYPTLPQTIPTHFDIHGRADKFGEKSDLWFIVSVMTLVGGGAFALVRFLPRIDPKKPPEAASGTYRKIGFAVVVFLTCINLVIVHSTQANKLALGKVLLPVIGLFFAVLGNYMHSIKPNYFIGFRTPWTLESEDNWRKTHQLVGKVWVPGGILIAIGSLLAPVEYGMIGMLVLIVPMVLIPAVYSYLYFKKHQH